MFISDREAKIIALQTVGGYMDVLINDVDFYRDEKGNVIRNQKDVDKIIKQLDIIAESLNSRANKLENGKATK